MIKDLKIKELLRAATSLPILSGVLLLARGRNGCISIQLWDTIQVWEHEHFPFFLKKRRGSGAKRWWGGVIQYHVSNARSQKCY